MAVHPARGPRAGFNRPSQQQTKFVTIPAPNQGVDARSPISGMSPENCIYTRNLEPAEYGMLLRPGYREWAKDIEDTPNNSFGVTTLMAFAGTVPGAANDRLFAVTNEGIWDVTTSGAPPVLEIAFVDQSIDAGHGVYAHYNDASGDDFLYYADSINGLFEYSEQTDTWVQASGITGPVIENIDYIVVHKQRLWLIERQSTSAWYLPVASRNGQATEFFFGSKFPNGGNLSTLLNWSVDGGAGIDDFLVAVSSSGDVIPYQGEDPSSADTWSVKGTYFIGEVPRGKRYSSEYSGDLYILSSFGLIGMSDLLRGVDTSSQTEGSLALKVARPLRLEIEQKKDFYGFDPRFMPSQGKLIISEPLLESFDNTQWVMNLATGGWGEWADLPMNCLEEWQGVIYFGTKAGQVFAMDVTLDNILLEPEDPLNNGTPVQFSVLTSYQNYGEPALFKKGEFVRPDFFSVRKPVAQTKIFYDYDFGQLTLEATAPLGSSGVWDSGLWDDALWGEGLGEGFSSLQGQSGIGRSIAVALRGESSDETRLVSFDVMWSTGWSI